jgi:hypothetical protein
MRPSGKPGASLRLSVGRGRLLCVVRLPRRDTCHDRHASELALVASLAAPYLRWLTVFRGQKSSLLDGSPHAA